MVRTFKILHGYDGVDCKKLFVRADQTNMTTRSATGTLNMRQQAARLEVRRNFFPIRVVEECYKIPSTIKMANSLTNFKNRYKKHRAVNGAREETPVWTMSGPRHSLRGPTWAIGSLPASGAQVVPNRIDSSIYLTASHLLFLSFGTIVVPRLEGS
jgi:hypothetical protein